MPDFHTLTISDVRQETADCTSIAFEVPDSLQDVFAFKQGQYLTLETTIEGERVRRSYSLCVSPLDGEHRVAIKQVPNGKFSTYANNSIRIGDSIAVMPPTGKFFTNLSANQSKSYVAFAAGSGITPILSIIKTTLQVEPQSTFQLFYSNKDVPSIIFKEEIEALKNKYLNRFVCHYFFSRQKIGAPLFAGRLTKSKLNQLCSSVLDVNAVDEFFICGPESMIFDLKEGLEKNNVDTKKIHFELFGTPATANANKPIVTANANGKLTKIVMIDGGKNIEFDMPLGSSNILDTALAQGADLPYACKGGVCCTCKAKLQKGSVEMPVNYGLEPEEIDAGYILTCQAIPTSEEVLVNFDEAM